MHKRCADVAKLCRDLDRDLFTFETCLMHSVDSDDIKVAVKVTSKTSKEEMRAVGQGRRHSWTVKIGLQHDQ